MHLGLWLAMQSPYIRILILLLCCTLFSESLWDILGLSEVTEANWACPVFVNGLFAYWTFMNIYIFLHNGRFMQTYERINKEACIVAKTMIVRGLFWCSCSVLCMLACTDDGLPLKYHSLYFLQSVSIYSGRCFLQWQPDQNKKQVERLVL